MRRNRITICCFVLLAVIVNQSSAQNPKQVTCSGNIVDDRDQPIAGVKVTFFELAYNQTDRSYDLKVAGKLTTKADGAFSFNTDPESEIYRFGYIVAEKQGVALGYETWNIREGNKELRIKLGKPELLSGIVVDENDSPVSDAEVSIYMLFMGEGSDVKRLDSYGATKLFKTKTDASGKFVFTNVPAEATVEFIIKKEGRATVITYESTRYLPRKLQFTPGQTDIKLVQPLEAKIKGIVVEKNTNKPISGIQITAQQDINRVVFGQEKIISKEDGTFTINSLVEGKYFLQTVSSKEGLADWVASAVEATIEAGKTKSGVKIELTKGGILEVKVIESGSKRPIEDASVSVREQSSRKWFGARSDKNGTTKIRLMPGSYQMSGAYKRGFISKRREENITIEDGRTKLITWQLDQEPKITGVVRDIAGKPIEGVKLKICPMGSRAGSITDAQGKFEISWNPRQWGDRETHCCLIARHEQLNLAASEEIGGNTKRLNIRLKPGVIFEGKVVDPESKGIANARINVMLQLSNWGSPLDLRGDIARTDSHGNFQVRAIPSEHEFDISARAEGYGQSEVGDVLAQDAVNNHLNVGQIQLPLANLSITGQIIDTQGNPVANARIDTYGRHQPSSATTSDKQGNFVIEGVCEGRISIRIDAEQEGKRLSSRVSTDGGASEIKIIVREGTRTPQYYIRSKTYEQLLKTSKKLIAGVVVDENGQPVADVPVGVRSIKRKRENGKFSWTFSSYQNLSDITDKQGRFAIELEEEGVEYSLLFSPKKHAAIIAYDIPANKKDIRITLPNGGTVKGRLVRMENGKKVPIENAEVKLEQESRISYSHLGFDRDRTVTTDSEGQFQFEHVRTKIRSGNRTEKNWKPEARVWKLSYGQISKNIGFYDGNMTQEVELVVKPKLSESAPLVNKPLPGFNGIKIDPATKQIRNKMMLVCFFDMNQRPSRYFIRQLKIKTKELEEKGCSIIAIQVAKVEANDFKNWIKNSGLSFPVGSITGEANSIRAKWSVKSLPWLILTDKNRNIRAAGFSLSELNEKIQSAKN